MGKSRRFEDNQMANRNWANGGKLYIPHVMPVLVDCNFIVDASNANGLGIRSLKGPGVSQVYMNTSAPLSGSGNPNPDAGIIIVKMQDNYNRTYGGFSGFVGPAGASSTSTVANVINIISVLGTATTAQWVAVGLPVGVTPAVGVAFVATSAAVIGGAAQTAVAAAAGAGIDHIEAVGNGNLSIAPAGVPVANSLDGQGATFYYRCYKNTVLTAPAAGTVISLKFYLSNSAITVQGE